MEAAVGKPQGAPIAASPSDVDMKTTLEETARRAGHLLQGNVVKALKLPGK